VIRSLLPFFVVIFLGGCQCGFEHKQGDPLTSQYDQLYESYRQKDIEQLILLRNADLWILEQAIECEGLLSPEEWEIIENRIDVTNAMIRRLGSADYGND